MCSVFGVRHSMQHAQWQLDTLFKLLMKYILKKSELYQMSHICCSLTNNENYNMHFIVIKKAIELYLMYVCVFCVEHVERNPILLLFLLYLCKKAMKFCILSIQQTKYSWFTHRFTVWQLTNTVILFAFFTVSPSYSCN